MFPDALVIDLLQPDVARELTAWPERLGDIVRGAPERSTVVLDEVQRVPELLNVVHALLESKDRRRFVLTGSSARKLRRGGVDLLAGRAVVRTLHPFMASELASTVSTSCVMGVKSFTGSKGRSFSRCDLSRWLPVTISTIV